MTILRLSTGVLNSTDNDIVVGAILFFILSLFSKNKLFKPIGGWDQIILKNNLSFDEKFCIFAD